MNNWRLRLANKFPFYYGWVVLGASILPSYSARPLMAIATLTVFLVPMTEHFGWSRGLFSGAVSLGGICGIIISPFVGRIVDRRGSSLLISLSSAIVGFCSIGLATIGQVWTFYALYVPARTVFASPLELGTSLAISNWFIRRRPLALNILSIGQGTGLALMPLSAQFLIGNWGWRAAWASLGVYTLIIGILPALLLMVRRPEDIGLTPDPTNATLANPGSLSPDNQDLLETNFTLSEALKTKAFWILAAFSVSGFMVQSGVSLHQVPHFIGQGVPPSLAVFAASNFALSQVIGGIIWSTLANRFKVRFLLASAGLAAGIGAIGTSNSSSIEWGLAASLCLGIGVGGLHLLLRLTWADYYGRRHLGSIRGVAHSAQIGGQVIGPTLAGFMFDITKSYKLPFAVFTNLLWGMSLFVLAATPPQKYQSSADST